MLLGELGSPLAGALRGLVMEPPDGGGWVSLGMTIPREVVLTLHTWLVAGLECCALGCVCACARI